MIKDPMIGFKKHPKFESSNSGDGGSSKNGDSSSAPNYAKMQRTLTGKINKLQQELNDAEKAFIFKASLPTGCSISECVL